jgi:hypothetical protein
VNMLLCARSGVSRLAWRNHRIAAECTSSHTLPICPLCGKACTIEDCVTDAEGKAVHRDCYRDALISQLGSL